MDYSDKMETVVGVRLARNNDNNPMIVWNQDLYAGGSEIIFVQWNGSSYSAIENDDEVEVISSDWGNDTIPQIAIDSQGYPIIAFADNGSDFMFIVIKKWNGELWEETSEVNYYPEMIRLAYGNNNVPIVAWSDNNGVYAATLSGSDLVSMKGDDEYEIAPEEKIADLEMVITQDNYPMLVWCQNNESWGENEISAYFTQWNGEEWVEGDGVSGGSNNISGGGMADGMVYHTDAILNSDDEISIALTYLSGYFEFPTGYYVTMLPLEIKSPKIIQSNKINGSITDIIRATLIADEILEGESRIEYFLSVDGGGNWIEVQKNQEIELNKVNDLRWKAILYKGSIPVLQSVHIEYATFVEASIDPMCGDASREYGSDEIIFSGDFCSVGTVDSSPIFPAQGESVSWQCMHEAQISSCSAQRKENEKKKEEKKENDCKVAKLKEVDKGKISLYMNMDEYFEDKEIVFEIEKQNISNGTTTIEKRSQSVSKNGKSILEIDNLLPDTQYRFKIEAFSRGKFVYCPQAKTIKTASGVIKVEDKKELLCGNAARKYLENELSFNGDFCQNGKNLGNVIFPEKGKKINWQCSNGKNEIQCEASREDERKKENNGQEDSPIPPPAITKDNNQPNRTSTNIKDVAQQSVVAIGIIAGLVMALASTAVPFFATMPATLKDTVFMPLFGLIMRRRNGHNWGVVFEATTKQGIPGVRVILMDKDKKNIETIYTDQQGRFGFLAKDGDYIVEAKKDLYEMENTTQSDSLYGDVYTENRIIEIRNGEIVGVNIAMHAIGIDWKEYAQKKIQAYNGIYSVILKWGFIVLYYGGFIFSGVITYKQPSILNITLISLYAGLFIYDNFIKKRSYGTIVSKASEPILFALVSLYNKETNERKKFAITDILGRYYLLAENGSYALKVRGSLMDGRSFRDDDGYIHVHDGLVRRDIVIDTNSV